MAKPLATHAYWTELDASVFVNMTQLVAIANSDDHVHVVNVIERAVEIAREIHKGSARADRPLVWAVCDENWPESLVHSELLGHVAGAFVGAYRTYRGCVWRADTGSLAIVASAPFSTTMQQALDRLALTGEVWPLGATSPIGRVDVRVIRITPIGRHRSVAVTAPA